MRTFLELLPFRIEQAISSRWLRTKRTRQKRLSTIPVQGSPAGPRRLFIDMAVISNHDAGTGIQRVVREIALALLSEAAPEWDIRFVSATRNKPYHRIAWPDRSGNINATKMRGRPGDIFLGLDYSLDAVRRHRRQLARFRQDGGSLWFLVHDLLPLHRPDWFSPYTVIRYKAWLSILAGLADGFLCNSHQTETELKDALAKIYGLAAGYRTQVLPMGSAIPDGRQFRNTEAEEIPSPRFNLTEPFALMVGTLEPRKGHSDIIAAFDELWKRGCTEKLVLVGRLGWQVDALRDLILAHPEYGAKLLWFNDIEDAELFQIYKACTGVIIASYGEGFGLPLIEALGHGKPVLARNLSVFRMHEGKGAYFFPIGASVQDLVGTIEKWLDAAHQGKIAVIKPTDSWRDASAILLSAIGDNIGFCRQPKIQHR